MPFIENPRFLCPEDDVRIWRYVDLTKFLSMLEKQSLYFRRFDKLADADPFEGLYTETNLRLDTLIPSLPGQVGTPFTTGKEFQQLRESVRFVAKKSRSVFFVNCWHASEHESAAMWKLYLKSDEGVAVQSTVRALKRSLRKYSEYEVNIGKVRYIDPSSEAIPEFDLMQLTQFKRKSFEHEKELRVSIWTGQAGKNTWQKNKYENEAGIYVPIDVGSLIKRVFVSPTAEKWFTQLVRSLCKRYKVRKPVTQSDLSRPGLY
jgi:hypothetical protein